MAHPPLSDYPGTDYTLIASLLNHRWLIPGVLTVRMVVRLDGGPMEPVTFLPNVDAWGLFQGRLPRYSEARPWVREHRAARQGADRRHAVGECGSRDSLKV